MPYPNFHAYRVKSPSLFDSIVVLRTLDNGIMIYGGPLKSNPNGPTTAQTYRFPKSKFTFSEAKKWMQDHNLKYIMSEKATQAFNRNMQLNSAGYNYARSLIESGKVDNISDWSFSTDDGNRILGNDNWNEYSKYHLATDSTYSKDTKQHYRYPFGKNGKVYRSALRAIRTRSGQYNQTNVYDAAGRLFDMLNRKFKEKTQAFNVRLLLKNIRSFSQNKIIELIPQEIYDKIIEKDAHPFFAMYSICHEGISAPVLLGEKQQKISWPKKAIQSIKNIFTEGVRLFKGHNKDNSHSGRKVIGRVIHSFQREIDGKLHHLVITYHPPRYRDEVKDLDVCSQEAEWNFFDYAGQLVAHSIEKLTGIALANSKEQVPAFREAKRLGYIQAFDESGKGSSNKGGKYSMAKRRQTDQNDDIFDQQNEEENNNFQNQDNEGNPPNFPNYYPPPNYYYPPPPNYYPPNNDNRGNNNKQGKQNQYPNYPPYPFPNPFQPQQQKQDNQQESKPLTYEEFKREAKRMKVMPSQLFSEDDLKADREFVSFFNRLQMAEEESEKKDKRIEELMREKELGTADRRISNFIKEEALPEPISNFIHNQFEEEKERIDDLSDQGLKTFVERKTKLFQDTAKIVYPEYDIKQKSGDNKSGDGGDMTKAENNELLDENYEV
jgi:hypothetical protein